MSNAHRYWRLLVTGIEGGDTRVNLAEVEFWDRRYARRMTGTYSESGTTINSGRAYDGVRQIGNLAAGYWVSNSTSGGPVWIAVDAGAPVELAAIVIWRSASNALGGANGNHIAAFDAQYSDDGSTWTTLWSESGSPLIADADMAVPGLFENPYYTGDPAPALDSAITPQHWLKLDDGIYSDAGSTPADNNDGIRQATNHGSDGTAFEQPSSGLRPTFRTGGLNGKPYLRCAYASAQRFADIAITQGTGSTSINRYLVAAVTDNVTLTNSPALIGSTASNGGKVGIYFQSNSGAQVRVAKNQFATGSASNPMVMVAAPTNWNRCVYHLNGVPTVVAETTLITSTAISAANLLWNDGISGDGFFDGDLYELMYINADLDDLAMFRVSEYLNAKYRVFGWPETTELLLSTSVAAAASLMPLRTLYRLFDAAAASAAGLTATPIIGQAIQLITNATAGAIADTRRMLTRAVTGTVAVGGALYRALYRLRSAAVAADAARTRTIERLRSASLAIDASAAVQAARARILSAAVSAAIALRRAVPLPLAAAVQATASVSRRAVQVRVLEAAIAVGAISSRVFARAITAAIAVAAKWSRFVRLARAAGVRVGGFLRVTGAHMRALVVGIAAPAAMRTRSVLMRALQAGASAQAHLSLVGLRLLRATVSAGAASHRAFLLVRRVGVRTAARLRRALTATLTAGVAVIGQVVADLFVVGRLLGQAMMRPAIGAAAAMRSLLDATGRMVARLRGSVRTKDD